jgi:flavin reductase (DIM6/NTAB) family NADH-FMN oxidoreductase RutF/rubredoxin
MNYHAFHKFSYGLYIVTTIYKGKKAGFIANTVFQVTSSPPQIAVSCSKNNETLGFIEKSEIFSVSVLKKETEAALIGEFGYMNSAGTDKFATVNNEIKVTGAPVITESSIAWLDCKVKFRFDTGSHILIIGEVLDAEVLSDEEPLTYAWYREKFKLSSPRNAPTYVAKDKLAVTEIFAKEPSAVSNDVQEVTGENEPFICTICGHVYRPEEGDPTINIPPGTPFSDLPEDFRCPVCNAGKDYYKPLM